MTVSQSSESRDDAFSGILSVSGSRSVRVTRLEAAGLWGLRFAVRPRLKFVAVMSGSCQLRLSDCAPQTVTRGSVLLIGRTAYGIASGTGSVEEDGDVLFRDEARTVVRLGGDDTVLLGGGLDVEATFADLLLDALPPVLSNAPAKGSLVALLLGLLETEAGSGRIGEALVTSRLSDLLLVEAIRTYAADPVAGGERLDRGDGGPPHRDHPAPDARATGRALDRSGAGPRGRHVSVVLCRPLLGARRPAAAGLPDTMADAAGTTQNSGPRGRYRTHCP